MADRLTVMAVREAVEKARADERQRLVRLVRALGCSDTEACRCVAESPEHDGVEHDYMCPVAIAAMLEETADAR